MKVGRRPPAIVLGLTGSAMGVLRSLSRLGVDVYGVYSDPSAELARHSRQLRARYRVADGCSSHEIMRVLHSIRYRSGTSTRPVLIPTDDTYVRFVAEYRDQLREGFRFRTLPSALGPAFFDKRATVDICREHGMPIPESITPDSLEDVERKAERLDYPVIIKPARTDDPSFPGKNIIAATAAELIAFYRKRPTLVARTMFQEVTPSGDGHIVIATSYSDINGAVLAQVSSRKLRQWLPDTGSGCYSASETLPGLLTLSRAFLEEIGYVGWASIEFAEDVETGEYRFLELNARVVYRNQLFTDAGVDLNLIGYLEMCGEEPPGELVQRDGVYWLDIHRDIPSFVMKWLRRDIGLAEWLASIRRASSFAIWERRDPKPFVASILRMVSIGAGIASYRQPLKLADLRQLLASRITSRPRR